MAAHPAGRPVRSAGWPNWPTCWPMLAVACTTPGRSTEDVDWAVLLDGPLPALVEAGRLTEASAIVEAAVGVDIAP